MRAFQLISSLFFALALVSPTCIASPPEPATEFALILDAPSIAEQPLARGALAQARNVILTQHQTLRAELAKRKITATGSALTLVNAVFVRMPMSRAAELQGLPGVRVAVPLPHLRRNLNRALDLVQASGAWSQTGGIGNAGAGVKIAVIDSGIDQTHPAFQDASLVAPNGFPRGDSKFTNSKVIVARSYVSLLPASPVDPQYSLPDDITPSDHFGHGTAIAMIAAGTPVKAPLASINGIAPKAYLGNYKIYGSPGINDAPTPAVVIQALEDALADGMDIAILASGSPAFYGPLDQVSQCTASVSKPYIPSAACDILTFAVEHAVQLGMTVVVSAGLDGQSGVTSVSLGTINSPGTAPSAITVGASTNSHVLRSKVSVADSGAPSNVINLDAAFGTAPKPGGPFTAPVIDVTVTGNDGLACDPLPLNSLNGSIALIKRGTCFFDYKSNNAKTAGAVAVLLYNSDDSLFVPSQLEDTAIPFVLIGNTAGNTLKSYIVSRKPTAVRVTLDPSFHEINVTPDVIAGFSSRGPSIGAFSPPPPGSSTPSGAIKPELVAPGTGIYTATERLDPNGDSYDASGYAAVEGDSFSAAMVAGAVALVKQVHPAYTPAQLKSAVVDSATIAVQDENGRASVNSTGAGKLNAQAAVAMHVTASPATVGFGAIGAIGVPLPSTPLTFFNSGASTANLTLTVAPRVGDANASVSVPSSVIVPPGLGTTVTVRLSGTRPLPGAYDGQINVAGSGVSLHIPYAYLVGDGVPANVFPVAGEPYTVVPGATQHLIAIRVVDRYGVPITGRAVTWKAIQGGGSVHNGSNGVPNADVQTDIYGAASALIDFGNQYGDQIFTADLNGISWEFDFYASTFPVISTNGVVNGASFQATPIAPGSFMTISGTNLAYVSANYFTLNLPLALAQTSVSFDVPSAGISVPGHVSYVSPTQINVQVPWELQGQTTAQMKVITANIASLIYPITLASYGPGVFEYPGSDSQLYAAALDTGSGLITTARPAGRGKYISLYMNGMGPVTHQPPSGVTSPESPLLAESVSLQALSVTIGGKNAPISFSGLAPDYVALYQVNVLVPQDAPLGVQPLIVTANGVAAKTSLIAVGP